jgi:hypothetical protein
LDVDTASSSALSSRSETLYAYAANVGLLSKLQPTHQIFKNILIDSGASNHMTPNKENVSNLQTVNVYVTLADGSRVNSTQRGTLKINVFVKSDKPHIVRLTDLLCVPSLSTTLFSVPSFLRQPGNTVSFFRDRIDLTAGCSLPISLPANNFKDPTADK